MEKRHIDDFRRQQPTGDWPAHIRIPTSDPSSGDAVHGAADNVRQEVDPIRPGLDRELVDVSTTAQMAGEDEGQGGVEPDQCGWRRPGLEALQARADGSQLPSPGRFQPDASFMLRVAFELNRSPRSNRCHWSLV